MCKLINLLPDSSTDYLVVCLWWVKLRKDFEPLQSYDIGSLGKQQKKKMEFKSIMYILRQELLRH